MSPNQMIPRETTQGSENLTVLPPMKVDETLAKRAPGNMELRGAEGMVLQNIFLATDRWESDSVKMREISTFFRKLKLFTFFWEGFGWIHF